MASLVKRQFPSGPVWYILNAAFGPICEGLTLPSQKQANGTGKHKPNPVNGQQDKDPRIRADYFEQITATDVALFIDRRVQNRDLAPWKPEKRVILPPRAVRMNSSFAVPALTRTSVAAVLLAELR